MERRAASTAWLSTSASGAEGPVTSTPPAAAGEGDAASGVPAARQGREANEGGEGKVHSAVHKPSLGAGPTLRLGCMAACNGSTKGAFATAAQVAPARMLVSCSSEGGPPAAGTASWAAAAAASAPAPAVAAAASPSSCQAAD